MDQPLGAREARKLIRSILDEGEVVFTDHARREMKKDDLTDGDAINVLRAGTVDEAEWENGAWRHHVRTQRMVFVVEIPSETELVVITAWRNR